MGKGGRPYKVHDDLTQLGRAVENGERNLIETIIENHGVDSFDGDRRTALIWSSFFRKVDLLNWLIDYGANVNWQDKIGYTALHFCGQVQNEKIAKILLDHGANPNLKDEYGNSALWTALFNARGNFEVVKILKKYGADPNLKNLHGRSPNEMAITIYKKNIKELIK